MITLSGHTFDETLLGPHSYVVDVGCHHGDFSKGILTQFGCWVEGYEPEPPAFVSLTASILSDKFIAFHRAVAGTTRVGTFYMSSAFNAGNSIIKEHNTYQTSETPSQQQVFCVSLSSIIERVGRIDLLKLDCEGAELEIIEQTPIHLLRKIRQISVEFHGFCIPTHGKKEIEGAMQRLKSAGFSGPTILDESAAVDCHYRLDPTAIF